MKTRLLTVVLVLVSLMMGASLAAENTPGKVYGPAAALEFDERYKGVCCQPGVLHCYPDAQGIPLTDCLNIIPMTKSLWTPAQLCADFHKRMRMVPKSDRREGIIVMLKTERCATKAARACTITTAALEKRSTPLVGKFLVYGVQIKPRDNDDPPGNLRIETGADAWKNEAAGEYRFEQGPGATLVFLDPRTGSKVARTNAAALHLLEGTFVKNQGRTPELNQMLREVLRKIEGGKGSGAARSKLLD